MTLNFNLLMKIFGAIQQVESTVHGGANKKQKAIEIITAGADVAGSLNPKVQSAIGQIIDATVQIHNGLDAAKQG